MIVSRSVFRENVPIPQLQIFGLHEPDLGSLGIGPEDPGNVFHFMDAGMLPVHVTGARADRECDPGFQHDALNDLVAQARAPDDRGAAAGMAERGLPVIGSSSLNLDSHRGSPPSAGASSATS